MEQKKSPPYITIRGFTEDEIKILKHYTIRKDTTLQAIGKAAFDKILEEIKSQPKDSK